MSSCWWIWRVIFLSFAGQWRRNLPHDCAPPFLKNKKNIRDAKVSLLRAPHTKKELEKDCLLKKQEECLVDRLLCFIIYVKNRWNFLFFATLVTQNMRNIKNVTECNCHCIFSMSCWHTFYFVSIFPPDSAGSWVKSTFYVIRGVLVLCPARFEQKKTRPWVFFSLWRASWFAYGMKPADFDPY